MTRESPRSPVSSVRLVSSLFLAVYRYHLVMSAHLSRARLLEKVVCEQVVCEKVCVSCVEMVEERLCEGERVVCERVVCEIAVWHVWPKTVAPRQLRQEHRERSLQLLVLAAKNCC